MNKHELPRCLAWCDNWIDVWDDEIGIDGYPCNGYLEFKNEGRGYNLQAACNLCGAYAGYLTVTYFKVIEEAAELV